MNKVFFPSLLFCFVLQLLRVTQECCAEFDERLWEKIGENQISAGSGNEGMAGLYIDPQHTGDITTKIPFADFHIIPSERKKFSGIKRVR